MALDWEQTFDFTFDMTNMIPAKFHIGYLAPGLATMVEPITKLGVIHPETKFDSFFYELTALVKTMEGKPLKPECSTLVFALRDNGAALTEARPFAKSRPFRIHNHEDKNDILDRMSRLAEDQWKDIQTSLSKDIKTYQNRALWLYQRAKLQITRELPIFEYFDSIQPAMVPQDSSKVRDWLHLQNSRSMKSNGARVDFNMPIEFEICIIPDETM